MSYGRKTTIQRDEHDQAIANALRAEKLAEAKIPPTILIGIGGTGAKALQVLRQEMLDYYGTVRTDRMQYIELDTEVAAQDPTLPSLKADPRKEKLRFDDQEFLSLSGTPVSSLVDNAMHIDGIKQWWDPNAKGESGRVNLSDGAAQIRPLGRLTYFHFRDTIRQKIQHAEGIVNNNVDGASGIEVFIVSGSAGGTGSSMTFDICADVRSIIGDCKITLVVCCASLHQLQDENARCYGNGHAFYTELNHYTKHPFVRNINGTKESIKAGYLFDFCYLCTEKNWIGRTLYRDPEEIYIRIGKMLFQNVGVKNMSAAASGVRVNRMPWLANSIVYSYDMRGDNGKNVTLNAATWNTKFSSFGIYDVYSQTRLSFDRAKYEIAADLLTSLIGDGVAGENTAQRMRELLSGQQLLEDGANSKQVQAIITKQGGRSLYDSISTAIDKALASGNIFQKSNASFQETVKTLNNLLTSKTKSSASLQTSGEYYVQLSRQTDALSDKLPELLRAGANQSFRTYPDLEYVSKVLSEISRFVNADKMTAGSAAWFQEQSNALAAQIEEYKKVSEKKARFLGDALSDIDMFPEFQAQLNTALKNEWHAVLKQHVFHFISVFLDRLDGAAVNLTKEIKSLIDRIKERKDLLIRDAGGKNKTETGVSDTGSGATTDSLRNVFQMNELKTQYVQECALLTIDDIRQKLFGDKEKKFFEQEAAGFVNVQLKKYLKDTSSTNSIYDDTRLFPEDGSVDLQKMAQDWIKSALPIIEKPGGSEIWMMEAHNSTIKDMYVGLPLVPGKETQREQLVEALRSAEGMGGALNGFNVKIYTVPTEDPSRITVMSEIHAFPLFYLPEISRPRGSKEHYFKLMVDNELPKALHIHKDWHLFEDLEPIKDFNKFATIHQNMLQFQMHGVLRTIPQHEEDDHKRYLLTKTTTNNLGQLQCIDLGTEKATHLTLSHKRNELNSLLKEFRELKTTEVMQKYTNTHLHTLIFYWMTYLYPQINVTNAGTTANDFEQTHIPHPSILTYPLTRFRQDVDKLALREHEGSNEKERWEKLNEARNKLLANLHNWTEPICKEKGLSIPMGLFSAEELAQNKAIRSALVSAPAEEDPVFTEIRKFADDGYFDMIDDGEGMGRLISPMPRLRFRLDGPLKDTQQGTSKKTNTSQSVLPRIPGSVYTYAAEGGPLGSERQLSESAIRAEMKNNPNIKHYILKDGAWIEAQKVLPPLVPPIPGGIPPIPGSKSSLPPKRVTGLPPKRNPIFEYCTRDNQDPVQYTKERILAEMQQNPSTDHFVRIDDEWVYADEFFAKS